MFSSRQPSFPLFALLFVTLLPLAVHGYFQVTNPTKNIEWANGGTYPVTWTKGLLDSVDFVDLELTRLKTDGLILIARDIPSSSGGINLALDSVPVADDYFLLFINSTHGLMYATSQTFSIVNNGSSNSSAQPLPSKPTVTVSGGPNPTAQFIATFGSSSGAVRTWHPNTSAMLSACFVSLAMFAGAAAVL